MAHRVTHREPVSAVDFEALARARLDPDVFDFFAGGAEDECSVADNREGFGRLALIPRVLVDVTRVNPAVDILGVRLRFR